MPNAIKFAEGSDDLLDVLAVPFSGPFPGGPAGRDTDGEYFSPNTDLCLEWFGSDRPVLFDHGLDSNLQTEVIGRVRADSATKSDDGWWVKVQLDKSAKYHAKIKQLIEAEALYASSGSMPHLVQRAKSGEITRWPWVELSLTPTPANLHAVVQPSEAAKHYKSAGLDLDLDALKAKLDAADRDSMSDADFAYIDSKGGRHLPVNDAAHVRDAVSRFNQTQFESEAAKKKAAGKIRSAAKKFGVKLDPDDLKAVSVANLDLDFVMGAAAIKALTEGQIPAEEPNGDAPEGSYEDLISDLNRLIVRSMNPGYGYVVATFPDYCIVRCLCDSYMTGEDDDDPAYYRYGYSVGPDGEPVLDSADPTPLEKVYQPMKAAGDLNSIPLALATEQSLKSLAALRERTQDLQQRRASEGRSLSQAHRQRLTLLADSLKAELAGLDGLLASAPTAEAEADVDALRLLPLRLLNWRLALEP